MPIIVQRTPPIPPKISQGPTPPTSAHSPDPDHHRTSPVLELNDILPQLSVMKGDSSVDPRVKLLARRKPVRKQIESDFYASSPPVASSSKSPAFPRKREPPVLHQGPFNSVFTTPSGRWTQRSSRRRVSGVMEEEDGEEEGEPAIQDRVENWPPKRHQGKGKGRAIEPPLDVTSHSEVPRSQHHPFSQPLQPPNHAPGADIGDEDHHPFSRPSLSPNHTLDIGVDDDHHPFSQESEPESPQPEEKQPPGPELEVVMSKNDLDMLENALELLTRPPASHTSPQPEQHPAEDPSLPNPLVSKSHDSGSAQHHIARLPEPFKPRNDSGAFLHYQPTPWYQDKERASTPIVLAPHLNRRHTFGGTAPVEKDLQPHEFLRQRFLAQQSSSPSTRLSQSPKPPEPAPQFRGIRLRPEDLERVIQTGMDSTLRLMAENHGQHLEAAKVMWERTGDLVLTDLGLRKMREAAQDAGEDYINSLQESVLEPEKQNDVPVPTPSRDVFNDQGSRRKSRSTLQFTPLDLEDEYEPLAGTRAAIVAHRMGNQKSYVSYSAGRSSSSNKSSQAVEGILDGDFGKGIQAESSFRVE